MHGAHIARLSGALIPVMRHSFIALNADAFFIQRAQTILRGRETLLRGFLKPQHGQLERRRGAEERRDHEPRGRVAGCPGARPQAR